MTNVDITSVAKTYGQTPVLADITTHFAEGSFTSLLGPSGSGKTTLLRIVAGFITPDSGKVAIGGADVTDTPVYARNIGMVFQSYALFPHMTVAQNVAFGLARRGIRGAEARKLVDRALEMVRLPDFGERRPKQLSGGQQQRVALARAVVIQPSVLLLDEPLSALDRRLRQEMQVELKRIQRETGLTTIFVTHDQEEALALSDKVAILDRGRIVQMGPPAEVYEQPKTRFAAEFLGDIYGMRSGAQRLNDNEARHSVGYLVNELLENAVKFRAPGDVLVESSLDGNRFEIKVSNYISEETSRRFQPLLAEITQGDPGELLIQRIEANAGDAFSSGSGLGLLTLMSDYGARLGWRFSRSTAGTLVFLEVFAALELA